AVVILRTRRRPGAAVDDEFSERERQRLAALLQETDRKKP
ncbi:cytochrome c-type biogenesis protein CcmH, partial [Serratia marcescens]